MNTFTFENPVEIAKRQLEKECWDEFPEHFQELIDEFDPLDYGSVDPTDAFFGDLAWLDSTGEEF